MDERVTQMDLTSDPTEALPTAVAEREIVKPGPDVAELNLELHVWKVLDFKTGLRVRGPLSGLYAMTALVVVAATSVALFMTGVLPAATSVAMHLVVAALSFVVVLAGGMALLLLAMNAQFVKED